jgi:phosphopantetheinyl transferase (holo-ACP synthase)
LKAEGLSLARVSLAFGKRHEGCLRRCYLHPSEERFAAGLTVDKRRVDYVAGRVAAKRALRKLAARQRGAPNGVEAALGPPTAIAVLPDEGLRAGAPVLFDGGGRRLPTPVSISHGAGFAYAAAAASGRLGLDVERIEPRLEGFVEGAFAPGEIDRWTSALGRAEADDRAVTVAWSAKEALLKLAGVGLRAPLESHAVRSIRWLGAPPLPEAERLDAAALAWAEITTAELGVSALGVATRRDAALVVVWDEG